MKQLPAWLTPSAITLLRAIAAERPDYRYRRYGSFECAFYKGANAKALREIYETSGHRPNTFSETADGVVEDLLEGRIVLPQPMRRAA